MTQGPLKVTNIERKNFPCHRIPKEDESHTQLPKANQTIYGKNIHELLFPEKNWPRFGATKNNIGTFFPAIEHE